MCLREKYMFVRDKEREKIIKKTKWIRDMNNNVYTYICGNILQKNFNE